MRGLYFRGVQKEDCSMFLCLSQLLSIKNPQPCRVTVEGLWQFAPDIPHPPSNSRKKEERGSRGNQTGKFSVFKCRNTLRNKIRSYGTTERTIFFLLLSAFSTMTSSAEAAAKTIWCVFRERQNVLSGHLLYKRRHGRCHGCSIPLTWTVCIWSPALFIT